MKEFSLIGMKLNPKSRTKGLEQIKKYISHPIGGFHIVSLNAENLVAARENKVFKKVIETSQIQLVDGAGVILAGMILGFKAERISGVELMEELLNLASQLRLRVLLIGGRPNLALRLAQCYQRAYGQAKFFGFEGIKNIKTPQEKEEKSIFSIVSGFKPHILFAAFGSPTQELWLDRHKRQLAGIVCMGVGGAFDYLGGIVPRAPKFLGNLGLEWLFRLMIQPWRWRRQLRLVKFAWLVLKQKLAILPS